MARLGDLYQITSGGTPSRKHLEYYQGGTISWVKTGDLKEKYLWATDEKITEIGLKNSSARIYPKDTVLVAMYGATIGASSILKIEAATNQACAAFVKRDDVMPEYLYAFLESQQSRFIKDAVGGAQPNISAGYLKEIDMPLIPIEEQRRIAALLDKVSDLIDKCQAQLDKLDLLVKARFVEMFGDPSVNTRWSIMKLSQLGELNRGVSKHRPRNDPCLLGGDYPLIQTGDVSNSDLYILTYSSTYSDIGLKQSRLWKSGTLCITIAANIAQTSILTFDACFPDSVVGFVPNDNTNSVFIHYWFTFFQKILEEQAPQVAQKNINLKILSDLDVIVPPYTLQEVFSGFVSRVEKSKLLIQHSLEKLVILKRTLMQQYFG